MSLEVKEPQARVLVIVENRTHLQSTTLKAKLRNKRLLRYQKDKVKKVNLTLILILREVIKEGLPKGRRRMVLMEHKRMGMDLLPKRNLIFQKVLISEEIMI